jgi:hypothetical protein
MDAAPAYRFSAFSWGLDGDEGGWKSMRFASSRSFWKNIVEIILI